MASTTPTRKSNGEKAGTFPKMLWEMLQYLEHQKRPLYKGWKEKLNDRVEWRVQVLIYTRKPNKDGVFKVALAIQASGRWSTFFAGIRDAACQAMYRVRDNCAHELSNTPYRYFPHRRICSTRKRICRYNYNKHRRQHGPLLIQQIRLTKALDAACDDALDALRETQFMLREREEELEALRRHKAMNGDEGGVSFGASGSSAISDGALRPQAQGDRPPAPGTVTAAARRRTRVVVVGNRSAACSTSLSFGAGGSSIITAGGHRPPSTQRSLFMHPAAVAVEAPRRDPAPAASSVYERRRYRSNLISIIGDDVGAALGKEPANANSNSPGDATTSSAPRSSARRRSLP